MKTNHQVALPGELVTKAEKRARTLGVTLTEYVQALVSDDVDHQDDPWRQPLPWEVEKRYLLDEIEFYDAEKQHPQRSASSAEELMNLLEEQSQQPDGDETD